jgi:hypothetical protein
MGLGETTANSQQVYNQPVCEMVEKMMGRVRAGHMNHGDERSCPSSTRLPRSTTLPSAVPLHTTPPIHPFDEKDEKWD